MRTFIALVSALTLTTAAWAGELDQPEVINSQGPIQGTIILKVSADQTQASVLKTDEVISNVQSLEQLATEKDAEFTALPTDQIRSEADREVGTSNWFFWYPTYNYYYPTYNCYYGGYNYAPYHNWYYGGYYYYGYSSFFGWYW